jgi:putative membrane protein
MPISDSDPRDFFTAERSLLAWLRTGLSVIAIGFVVSRFGLFLEGLALRSPGSLPPAHSFFSAALGVAFVIAGTLAILVAAVQHQRFVATLSQAELPRNYSTVFAVAFSFCVGALGMVLAAYLLVSQP